MKQCSYIVTTALKTRDAVAETAYQTLTNNMKYSGIVTGLTRQDWWKVDLITDNDQNETESIIKELAEKTRVFVNFNKHSYRIIPNGTDAFSPDKTTDGQYVIHILIQNREDRAGKNALKTLQALYDKGKYVANTENGVLWTLILNADSEQQAHEYAEDIAKTQSRDRGLLANTSYQNIFVL
jgi:hypothetical protein